jgi:hypothetical protein
MVSAYAMFVKEHIHEFSHLPAKQRMKAVAELYHKQKDGHSMPSKKGKGRPKKGGAFNPLDIAKGVSSALPVVGDLVSGVKDLFSGKPDPDKQTQRDYMLREYNRVNGTRFGVEGLHWNVPYGAGLKKRGRPSKKGGLLTAGSLLGLGLKKKGGAYSAGKLKRKGGAMTAGALNPQASVQSPLMSGKGGNFADSFLEGLTAPFKVASLFI